MTNEQHAQTLEVMADEAYDITDTQEAALRAGAAALRAPQGETWQPIETAPKDGTQVLLWITGMEPRPRISFWSERGSDSGWYSVQSHHFIATIVTHWQPLPLPPVSPVSETP